MRWISFSLLIACAALARPQWRVVYLNESLPHHVPRSVAGYQCAGNYGWAQPHAALWTVPGGLLTDMHPGGYVWSYALDAAGGMQVGEARLPNAQTHAALWTGTASSFVSLHPAGHDSSSAVGTNGFIQVGYTNPVPNSNKACKWSGTSASWVDIHPVGFTSSFATACDDEQIVGVVATPERRAVILEPAFVNLHPAGFFDSGVSDVHNGQQVGHTRTFDGRAHAALWSGSAQSWVDLHDPAWQDSSATAVFHGHQVGQVRSYPPLSGQASLWYGTQASRINLHQFVAGFPATDASGIWIDGSRTFICGTAQDESFRAYGLLWISQTVQPASFVVIRGIALSGNLASLMNSDNNKVVLRPGIVFQTSEPPVQISFTGTATESFPSGLSFSVEASANFGNAQQRIFLYNYQTNQYELVDSRLASISDETITATVPTNASRFIEPGTLAVRALLTFRAVGPSFAYPWSVSIDKAWWNFPG